jgi:hypothetical protein
MRVHMPCRKTLLLAAAVAGLVSAPGMTAAQTKIYPEGTDCANQRTIAERLLCGRQEFRREHGLSVVQPTIVPQGSVPEASVPDGSIQEPDPIPAQPTPPAELRSPSEQQEQLVPHTASPNH